ncbi:hypothetical protein [Aridibaculum aurantiacum]|uniref:hypothetical protein n=1 Tax=Aridibaculum aurantiacum TaxID=2810307 RepID=UPI001A96493C|nr:hypothetical protein [Aridibaculum aurantiacum]
MKKSIFYLLMIPVFFFATACSSHGDIPSSDVPQDIITNFNSRYPGADHIKWKTEKKDGKTIYEAEFLINGAKVEAEFDEAGNFIREED